MCNKKSFIINVTNRSFEMTLQKELGIVMNEPGSLNLNGVNFQTSLKRPLASMIIRHDNTGAASVTSRKIINERIGRKLLTQTRQLSSKVTNIVRRLMQS